MTQPSSESSVRSRSDRRRLAVRFTVGFAVASAVAAVPGTFDIGIPAARGVAVVAGTSRPPRIGMLSSPGLGRPLVVYEGVASSNPSLITAGSLSVPGAVHIPQSARPGGLGVAVIAAHRTTWPRPFYNLDKIVVGDPVTYTDLAGQLTTYRVVATTVVRNDDAAFAEVMNNEVRYGSDARLTLYACSRANGRPTSTRYRLIVSAVRVAAPASPS